MPTEKIVEFVLYITPGFLAIEIYRSIYPGKPLSEFSKITWSVIYGVLIYIGVRWIDNRYLCNFLNSKSPDFPNLRFTLGLFAASIIIGCSRSFLHFARFELGTKFYILKGLIPDPQSIWAKINQPTNHDWAVVYLDDSSIYLGYIGEYTFDPSVENQDFLLSDAKRVDENLKEIYLINGIGVYLNTRNVKRIEFLKSQ